VAITTDLLPTAEAQALALKLEHVQGYEFRIAFDWPDLPDFLLNEPTLLGARTSRLLAAAAANFLSASLLCSSALKYKLRAAPRGMDLVWPEQW
jgi:hypothetical protein